MAPADPTGDLRPIYAAMLRKAGASVDKIIRILPPRDCDDEVELLYLDRAGLPCTAYVYDREGAVPLLANGW